MFAWVGQGKDTELGWPLGEYTECQGHMQVQGWMPPAVTPRHRATKALGTSAYNIFGVSAPLPGWLEQGQWVKCLLHWVGNIHPHGQSFYPLDLPTFLIWKPLISWVFCYTDWGLALDLQWSVSNRAKLICHLIINETLTICFSFGYNEEIKLFFSSWDSLLSSLSAVWAML